MGLFDTIKSKIGPKKPPLEIAYNNAPYLNNAQYNDMTKIATLKDSQINAIMHLPFAVLSGSAVLLNILYDYIDNTEITTVRNRTDKYKQLANIYDECATLYNGPIDIVSVTPHVNEMILSALLFMSPQKTVTIINPKNVKGKIKQSLRSLYVSATRNASHHNTIINALFNYNIYEMTIPDGTQEMVNKIGTIFHSDFYNNSKFFMEYHTKLAMIYAKTDIATYKKTYKREPPYYIGDDNFIPDKQIYIANNSAVKGIKGDTNAFRKDCLHKLFADIHNPFRFFDYNKYWIECENNLMDREFISHLNKSSDQDVTDYLDKLYNNSVYVQNYNVDEIPKHSYGALMYLPFAFLCGSPSLLHILNDSVIQTCVDRLEKIADVNNKYKLLATIYNNYYKSKSNYNNNDIRSIALYLLESIQCSFKFIEQDITIERTKMQSDLPENIQNIQSNIEILDDELSKQNSFENHINDVLIGLLPEEKYINSDGTHVIKLRPKYGTVYLDAFPDINNKDIFNKLFKYHDDLINKFQKNNKYDNFNKLPPFLNDKNNSDILNNIDNILVLIPIEYDDINGHIFAVMTGTNTSLIINDNKCLIDLYKNRHNPFQLFDCDEYKNQCHIAYKIKDTETKSDTVMLNIVNNTPNENKIDINTLVGPAIIRNLLSEKDTYFLYIDSDNCIKQIATRVKSSDIPYTLDLTKHKRISFISNNDYIPNNIIINSD